METKVLEELMRCGAVRMNVEKSCAIVEITEAEFYASPEAQKAYRTGQYKGEYTWRQSVFKGAKDGIPQMCKLFQSLIQNVVVLNNPNINMEEYYDCNYETPDEHDDSRIDRSVETSGKSEGKPFENSGDTATGLPDEPGRND
ncbi:MAG: hypothetical protein Q4E67_02030 [Planctomycetia bacterium]|nr:hypothetical protein [Planctomycetia bacterium]